MRLKFANFAESVLSSACEVGSTELFVDSVSKFPTLGSGEKCRVTIYDGENEPEIVEVSAIGTASLTVTRAQEGTAARAWDAGAKVRLSPTAEMLESLFSRLEVTYCPTVAGTANAIELTSGENLTSWQTGQIVLFKATATSTDDDVTVSVDGLTPLNLRQLDGTTKPEVGAIVDGLVYMLAIVDGVAILLFPLPQSSAFVGESLKIYGAAEVGTLTVLGAALGVSPSASDDSARFATTAWVLARLAEIAVPEIVNFSTSLTIPNNTAYRSKLADTTVNELLKINTSDEVILGGAGTGVVKVYTGGANNFTIGSDGVPTHPTPSAGDNTTKSATTAFVKAAVDGALAGGYATLASPEFTGTPRAPTAAGGTNTTQIASTAFVTSAVAPKAPIDSPTFTGTPAAPTAAAGTNTTQVATTAFVKAAVDAGVGSATVYAINGTGAYEINVDFSTYYSYEFLLENVGAYAVNLTFQYYDGNWREPWADTVYNYGSYTANEGRNTYGKIVLTQRTLTRAVAEADLFRDPTVTPPAGSLKSCKMNTISNTAITKVRFYISSSYITSGSVVVVRPLLKR